MEYITITDPGKTTFKVGEIVSREAFDKENERVTRLGEKPATGRGNPMIPEDINKLAEATTKKIFSMMSLPVNPQVWVLGKGQFPLLEKEIDEKLKEWSRITGVSPPTWYFTAVDDIGYDDREKVILLSEKMIKVYRETPSEFMNLWFFIAHEFAHHNFVETKTRFKSVIDEESSCNKLAQYLSHIKPTDAFTTLHNLLPEIWEARKFPPLEEVLSSLPGG